MAYSFIFKVTGWENSELKNMEVVWNSRRIFGKRSYHFDKINLFLKTCINKKWVHNIWITVPTEAKVSAFSTAAKMAFSFGVARSSVIFFSPKFSKFSCCRVLDPFFHGMKFWSKIEIDVQLIPGNFATNPHWQELRTDLSSSKIQKCPNTSSILASNWSTAWALRPFNAKANFAKVIATFLRSCSSFGNSPSWFF